jgi:hypothetical protein
MMGRQVAAVVVVVDASASTIVVRGEMEAVAMAAVGYIVR